MEADGADGDHIQEGYSSRNRACIADGFTLASQEIFKSLEASFPAIKAFCIMLQLPGVTQSFMSVNLFILRTSSGHQEPQSTSFSSAAIRAKFAESACYLDAQAV